MLREEALDLLETVELSDEPSKVNPAFTITEVLDIVYAAIVAMSQGKKLNSLTEKRVWQVVKNQKRPKY